MPTHYQGTERERRALNTFIKLNRAVVSLATRLSQRNTHPGLTPSQFGVLEALYHLGSMCQSEISTKLLLSTGNLTLVVDNLEKHGWVQRQRSPQDRRFVTVSLTQSGRELIQRILPGHVAAITEEMSMLDEQEQESLGELCRILGKGSEIMRTEK
ncbi:MAG: MarR family transcriptional regulator [Anaerolineales bacterium]|nr:MarR family transcriptional regulator [Anaerolineales bacterium]